MNTITGAALAAVCGLAASLAHANCSDALTHHLASAESIVGSLRPDKPAQMRVYASDGSEYGAGQVTWMKGQLHSASLACARGDESSAESLLRGVTDLMGSRRRD
jgi:hypothetical protein